MFAAIGLVPDSIPYSPWGAGRDHMFKPSASLGAYLSDPAIEGKMAEVAVLLNRPGYPMPQPKFSRRKPRAATTLYPSRWDEQPRGSRSLPSASVKVPIAGLQC